MPKLSSVLITLTLLLVIVAFIFFYAANPLLAEISAVLATGLSIWAERQLRNEQ